ncbi:MAG: dephospho-CoA kinase [Acidimicrobiaceae bacterium]|nr:dephospho-CoA kinase [Acidimicrobiaceae bacterium]
MLVVGLCGGIGAGKSTVADLLAGHGARVIDVDALGREVLTHDDVRAQVAATFGDGVLAADGSIDRSALAAVVFAGGPDDTRLAELEAISHPAINRELARRLDALAADPPPLVVLDMAVLVESELGRLPDGRGYTQVVVVEADPDVRLERAVARGMDADDVRARMAAQATDTERRAVAHHVLTNDGNEESLARQVAALWDRLTEPG